MVIFHCYVKFTREYQTPPKHSTCAPLWHMSKQRMAAMACWEGCRRMCRNGRGTEGLLCRFCDYQGFGCQISMAIHRIHPQSMHVSSDSPLNMSFSDHTLVRCWASRHTSNSGGKRGGGGGGTSPGRLAAQHFRASTCVNCQPLHPINCSLWKSWSHGDPMVIGLVFLGKIGTGNPWFFYHQIDRAFRLKLSHHPILWNGYSSSLAMSSRYESNLTKSDPIPTAVSFEARNKNWDIGQYLFLLTSKWPS